MTDDKQAEADSFDRWAMIRDIAVLQVKLIVDGLRDFLLVPASIVAGIVSLVGGDDDKPAPHFYRLLYLGRRSERWINLFGALDRAPKGLVGPDAADDLSIDDLVERLEGYVVDEYKRGGVTSQAKQRIDAAIDAIQRRATGDSEDSDSSDA